ncbi:glycosyltransferase [Actinomadura barringtoniae]|uniref:Glycosyltransferase n=1 Tax=Actinomadura barringtoniae TaxID=1427535 RepID=A0A939P9M2_9ACTN|nr:glycosyltransferase family 2 protein [Actinomadura barringtoniae]MBO2448440.1 glycosyltransferase [Actinomadura barringtoniae]
MSPTPDRHVVTAVLVAHEGARWLPETLKALLTQTRPVQRLVAVDTGSRDRGPAVLAEVVGAGNVLTLPRTTGYGEAVAEALRHAAASLPVPEDNPGEQRTEWVWLLHDDSAPAHDALALLLRVADNDPNATVLGAKLRDWTDRRVLLEIGVAMDGAGRRETGLDRREFDQGQHDGIRDVLAVSSAGMLVRRDVWERLGGFDLEFGLFRDDIDFCWRAHAAGQRVVAVSDAVVFHAEASRRGVREIGMAAESARRRDRRNALYTLLANLPLGVMFRALARNVWSTLVRALLLLVVKQPQAARDEVRALGDVLRSPGRLRRARAARADGRRHVYRSIKRFQPRWVAARHAFDTITSHFAEQSDASRREAPDDIPIPEGPGPVRRLLAHPGIVLVIALTVVSIAAERSLLTAASRLGGGALVPAWGGASDLWSQYVSGWHPVGLGSAEGSPPYVGVLAVLSTLAFGKPWVVVSVLLLGSVPLAGLTAYLAARLVVPETPRSGRRAARRRIPASVVRAWFAAVYALLPAATGAIAGGRLGAAVVIVLLPLIAVQVARMYGLPRSAADADPIARAKRAGRASWAVALLLTIAMAFVPLTWPLALAAGGLTWALFAGRQGPRGRRNLVIALAVPPLLLLPWTLGMIVHPSRFLLEAGLHTTSPVPTARELLALNPGGPGAPAQWTTYGLLAIALCALPLRGRRTAVLAGWMLAIFGSLVAILVSTATVSKGADSAPAWPGVALVFAAAGVLLAATALVQRGTEVLAGRHLTYRAFGALIVLAAITVPALAAGTWIVRGAGDPVGRVSSDTIPSFVQDSTGPRTLVLHREPTGRVAYTLLRGTEPMLGEAETPVTGPLRNRLDDLVSGLAGGRGGEGRALTRMGVQYVLVPRPEREPLTEVLDADPELTRLARSDAFGTWGLPSPAGRLMLMEGQTITPLEAGHTDAAVQIPPGDSTRTLLLAEPADGGWHASLNGDSLKSEKVDGWAQGYEIPASGGQFELTRGMWMRHTWIAVQAFAVIAVAVLALPGAPAAEAESESRGRRRAGTLARKAARRADRGTQALRRRARDTLSLDGPDLDEQPAEPEPSTTQNLPAEEPVSSPGRRSRSSGSHRATPRAGDSGSGSERSEREVSETTPSRSSGSHGVQSGVGEDDAAEDGIESPGRLRGVRRLRRAWRGEVPEPSSPGDEAEASSDDRVGSEERS